MSFTNRTKRSLVEKRRDAATARHARQWRVAPALPIVTLLTACAGGMGSTTPSSTASLRGVSMYCQQIVSMRPQPGMTFDQEGPILRAAGALAPPALHDDFQMVLIAYEQVQDREDGTISADQVTLVGSTRLTRAMTAIDDYTARSCGVHVAQVLPFPAGS